MEFKNSYGLKLLLSKYTILYRVVIIFKSGKVKKYRRVINYQGSGDDILLRVLNKKGYDINIVKNQHYIKDIKVDISGLAWHYEYGKYHFRRLFNEVYYYD